MELQIGDFRFQISDFRLKYNKGIDRAPTICNLNPINLQSEISNLQF